MKSFEDIIAIRDTMRDEISVRNIRANAKKIHIIVSMGDSGMNNGARRTLTAFMDEIDKNNLNIVLTQKSANTDKSSLEPIVTITEPNKDDVIYVNATFDKVKKIIDEHIIGGKVVTEYMEGN